jgi:hypothetical protein
MLDTDVVNCRCDTLRAPPLCYVHHRRKPLSATASGPET